MTYYKRYDDPRLTGVVIKEKVRCGKPGCRCNRGLPHKWYYYLYYRQFEGIWKLRKEYIARHKVKALKREIEGYKREDKKGKVEIKQMWGMLRFLKKMGEI